MHRVVTGATGLIGKRLVEHWLNQQHTVTVIGRTQQHIEEVFGQRVQAVTWDRLTPAILQSAEAVVNLAGANIGSKRWNAERKKEILQSRVEATRKIAGLLAGLGAHAPALLNASGVGVYGLQTQLYDGLPPRLDESTRLNCDAPPDFLSQIVCEWEKAAQPAIAAGVRVVFLRFGGVLAKEGGALSKMMQPYLFFLGGPIGTGHQPFSWVAIDDVIRAIDFLLANPVLSGPFNVAAPEGITQRMLSEAIGKALNRPAAVTMPAFLLKLILGEEMAQALLLEGQHAYPRRLLEAGFKFEYPEIDGALKHILQ